MPKPQPYDNFQIIIEEVSPEQLGPYLAICAKAGMKARQELVTNIPTYAKRASFDVQTGELLETWLKDHPTFKAIEVVKFFEAMGRTRGSAYPALVAAVEKGVLKKLDEPGHYSRADIKHIEPPKKTRVAKGPPKKFTRRADDVVLSFARRNHGRVNTHKLIDLFEAEGRARNSVYACIDGLMKRKQLKRVGSAGSGQYMLLASAVKTKPAKQIAIGKTPAPLNGAVVEELING
jgi:hypothetical protein